MQRDAFQVGIRFEVSYDSRTCFSTEYSYAYAYEDAI